MSERIEYLLHKAHEIDLKQHPHGIRDQHRVAIRFARMIINHCVDQIRHQYSFAQSSTINKSEYWKGFIECGEFSVDAIERHFDINIPNVPVLNTIIDERDTAWGQLTQFDENDNPETTWDITHFDQLR